MHSTHDQLASLSAAQIDFCSLNTHKCTHTFAYTHACACMQTYPHTNMCCKCKHRCKHKHGHAKLTKPCALTSVPWTYALLGFNAARDGAKLRAELTHNLTRATAWEAVMRVRCSRGLRISSFHGHFFNRSVCLCFQGPSIDGSACRRPW